MTVVEPDWSTGQHLRAALTPVGAAIQFTSRDEGWKAGLLEGQPVVRILIKGRWWELVLACTKWSGGTKAAYESIASGVAGGEISLYTEPSKGKKVRRVADGDLTGHSKLMCRIVAWLPRVHLDVNDQQAVRPEQANQLDRSEPDLEGMGLLDLREAIRANLVSFPSQVPTFQKHDRTELPRRIAQLYFVLGWNCTSIGSRYGLSENRVRQILNSWRHRAIKGGYIQLTSQRDVVVPPRAMHCTNSGHGLRGYSALHASESTA